MKILVKRNVPGAYAARLPGMRRSVPPDVQGQRGASLIEVLVALSLIAFVLTTTLSFLAAMQAAERRLEAHGQVLRLVELQLELMRSVPYIPTPGEVDLEAFFEQDDVPGVDLSAAQDVRLFVEATSEPQPFLRYVVVRSTYSVVPGDSHEQRLETLMFVP